MRYYRYRWSETRGDKYNNWGFSKHLFEIGEDGYPTRQLEVYDNGIVVKYDEKHLGDEYGMLADVALENDELQASGSEEITAEEFEKCWTDYKALNQNNN